MHSTQIAECKKRALEELPTIFVHSGSEIIYPKSHLSQAGIPSVRYPYLLGGISIDRIDQVWSCDIIYIRLVRGFVYLMAIIDWFSPFVLS